MSDFPARNLTQTAVYWSSPVDNGYGGYTWEDPVEICCRWTDSRRVLTDKDGEELTSASMVILGEDVDIGGMLLLGTLDDLESGEFNDPVAAEAFRIVRFDRIPSIRGDKFYRVAYLNSVYRPSYL